MRKPHLCKLCGEPMPEDEGMFFYHGYSGKCPKPPIEKQAMSNETKHTKHTKEQEKPSCGHDSIGRFYCGRVYLEERISSLEAQLEKLSGKTGYCTECERLGRENKELAYDRAHMDSLRKENAELYRKNKELREAVVDYRANLTADISRKSCGHEFHCVCSGDRLDKALSGGD
jgi:hypothetical protein